MQKTNYSTIIDFGSSEIRLGVFDEKLSNLFYESKVITQKDNNEEYLKSVNFLVRKAENKISSHLENVTILYDTSKIYTIDLSIKKKLDQKIDFKKICSSIILEAKQLINDCYVNKKIIHSIIKKYIINGKEFFEIPDKISEINSLILEIKFVCLPYNQFNKIFEIFKKNNLKLSNLFISSLVKSFKYLELFKKNKFVAFLDIGLDRTTIVFFINQKLDFLNSIPIGGNHISKDISQIMKLSLEESEKIKKTFNRSEIDFSYSDVDSINNIDFIKKIIGKNISIDLLKNVVLTRIEEIIELSFKSINFLNNIEKKQDLNLVLIGNGSKIFNKNSFHIEDKYNLKEISFYEETGKEICEAGLIFEKNFIDEDQQKLKKNLKKVGIFHRFFNIFGDG